MGFVSNLFFCRYFLKFWISLGLKATDTCFITVNVKKADIDISKD